MENKTFALITRKEDFFLLEHQPPIYLPFLLKFLLPHGKFVLKWLLFWVLLLIYSNVQAQNIFSVKYIRATINGTSSLHDWESKITKVDFIGFVKSDANTIKKVQDVEVKIQVVSIKSKEGETMDRKTYEAFKSDRNPFILYTFSDAQVNIDANQNVSIKASGKLSMAGTTKIFPLEAKGKLLTNGDLQLLVTQKINMKDFNMIPPTAVLGTIKVGEEVTVTFDFVLTPTK